MYVERLSLTREAWGPNKGRLTGKVEFANDSGTIQLNLSEEMSSKVLAVCADCLVESSKQVAERMTAQIINATPAALESKPAQDKGFFSRLID